ncbi:hypothetical protein LR48_Vigan01g103700 [Vigna angularis]|uniref:Uncharacterized protein n=1 Tax=Phaseolus angularis TaxID=3914 RepID=A0A0L9TM25_PHAAN|nr:hypothetical protein LR48_Vigan01g103700 [Vigna angularis]
MAASSSRPGKCSTSSRREADPFGWFSDDDQRTDFICQWEYKEVIRHKGLSISFFRSEGFLFQEWLEKVGLTKFVELQGDCYPNLVKNVDITNERTICCNKQNVLEELFLDSVGFRKGKEGWVFKDEYIPEFVDERFKRLDEKMMMLQRSFTKLHQKMDYVLRINAFGDTSIDDSESGKNSAEEKIVESSETE